MKKVLSLFILLILLTLLTGCWDNRDITELSVASAVGIDKKDGLYEVSVQIIKPSGGGSKSESGGQSGGGGENSGTWVVSETGESPFDAIRNLLKFVNRKVFFGHTKFIAFGEEIAANDIGDTLDLFERDTEFKYHTQIIITKNISAKQLLETKSSIEQISATHMESILKNQNSIGKIKDINILRFIQELESYGKESVISVIEPIEQKDKYEIEDLRVNRGMILRRGKSAAYLNSYQLRGYLFTQNNVDSALLVVFNPIEGIKRATIEIKSSKAKLDVEKISDNKFSYIVNLQIEAVIGTQTQGENAAEIQNSQSVAQKASDLVKGEIQEAFNISKQVKADIFGFGEYISRKYPEDWKNIRENWDYYYPENDINISVDTYIRNSGLLKEPINIK